jgi:hypothetical protein
LAAQDEYNLTTVIRPSPLEYSQASGIEILRFLELAAKLIPVPFLGDVIKLALTVLQACEVSQFPSSLHFMIPIFSRKQREFKTELKKSGIESKIL